MKTEVILDSLEPIVKGLNKTADIVKSTMGAQGKTVIISTSEGNLRVTKDGVSVAEAIELKNDKQNIGAKILTSASKKTVNEVGDGTTATAVLLQSMVNGALPHLEDAGKVNEVIEGMEYAVNAVCEQIKKEATEITSVEQIEQIANIASNNSEKLGELFKSLYTEVGFNSLVTLEKDRLSDKTTFEVMRGIRYESGMAHSLMANQDENTCIFHDPIIHISEEAISVVEPLKGLLDHALNHGTPVVIIAPEFSDGFVRLVIDNINKMSLPVVLIKSPGYGPGIKKNYEDIRAYLDEDNRVDKITVTTHDFVLYNTHTPKLDERLKKLKILSEHAIEGFDQTDFNERMHKLKGSIGIIFAGGVTDEARDEEYDRVEDALGAVKAAIRSGFVRGGGTMLYNSTIDYVTDQFSKSAVNGMKIVMAAIKEPAHQIIKNANLDSDVILKKVTNELGFNVKSREYEDFLQVGVIDPADVLIQSLTNSLASCKLLINTSYSLFNRYPNRLSMI